MKFTYKHTLIACYTGYIVQAIINTLPPLLYIIFNEQLGISLTLISVLIALNFIIQISVDAASAIFITKLGYRRSVVLAHILATAGLVSLAVLTSLLDNKFLAIAVSSVLMAMGGGIIEVIVSPMVEALPGDQKASAMSILHSFYCWGQVAVILLTTIYIFFLGIEAWIALPILWAAVPAFGAMMFAFVPINTLPADNDHHNLRHLFKEKAIYPLLILMVCGGAAEVSFAQWASFYTQITLNIPKSISDLLGPCSFAVAMGLVRVFFGKFADRLNLEKSIAISFSISIVAYFITALSNTLWLSLLGFILAGLSVAILWPGTYSLGAQKIKGGGTIMFAILAMAGDIGCTLGPDLVGVISDAVIANGNGFLSAVISGDPVAVGMKTGLLLAVVFPLIGLFTAIMIIIKKKSCNDKEKS